MAHVVLGDITPSSKLTVVKHRNLSLLKKKTICLFMNGSLLEEHISFWRIGSGFREQTYFWKNGSAFAATDTYVFFSK